MRGNSHRLRRRKTELMPLLSSFAITRLYLEVASSLFSGIICLYLFLLYQEATPTVRIFRKFSVTIFAENLVDLLCGYLNGMVTYENTLVVPAPLILFVNLVDVVGGCLCSYYFLQYACVHAGQKMGRFPALLSRLVVLLNGSLMIVNFFNGCVLSIPEGTTALVHGPLYLAGIFLPSMILLVWGIVLLLRHFRRYTGSQRLLLIITGGIVTVLILLQALFVNVYLVLFAVTVGNLGLLFTLETPDYMALKKALSRLQKTQNTLRSARKRAEDASVAKSEFIISAADQFRGPISAILGFSRLIASGTGEEKTRGYAEKVQEAGQRLQKVFESIVYYTASDYREEAAYEKPKVASIEDQELFSDYMEEWKAWERAKSQVGEETEEEEKDTRAQRQRDIIAFAQANAPVEAMPLFRQPVTILAVDDNNMNLFLISNRLRRFGAQTDLANSAETALSMAESKPYDLILLDRLLPTMDGSELVRILRERKLCEGTPVILMSAGSEETREELQREGFAGSLPKPFTLHQLRDLLIQVLPESVNQDLPEVQEVLSGGGNAPKEESTAGQAPEENTPEEKEPAIPVSFRPALCLCGMALILVCLLLVTHLIRGNLRVLPMAVGSAGYLLLDLLYGRLSGASAKISRLLPLPLLLLCILAGTFGARDSVAFIFFPVLLFTPLLLQRTNPAWNCWVLVLSSALFLLLDYTEKASDLFQKDLIHTMSAMILALVFSLVLQQQRARENDLVSRYRELSEYDRLTHTKNDDRMREDLKSLFGQKVTFLYTSIDRFRLICDTCGTEEANDLLAFFAATLQKTFGEEHCYRYYGAVFLVIQQDLSLEELRKKCSVFSRAVSRYEIAHRRLHPTCSGSYDRILLTGEEDLQSLSHRLGMKLYEIQTLGNKRFEQADRSPFSEGD